MTGTFSFTGKLETFEGDPIPGAQITLVPSPATMVGSDQTIYAQTVRIQTDATGAFTQTGIITLTGLYYTVSAVDDQKNPVVTPVTFLAPANSTTLNLGSITPVNAPDPPAAPAFLVLGPSDLVPPGTPSGTVIFRRTS